MEHYVILEEKGSQVMGRIKSK